jgi:protein-disulfide isomerase
VIPDLIEQYVDTGKARYVYREFPLTSIHPAAQPASEAAICAGEQGKYWEMNEHLFDSVAEWSAGDPSDLLLAYAGDLGLDADAFQECLDSGQGAAVVQSDLLAGEMAGVDATPYFFINDMPIKGGLPVDQLGQIIDYVAAGGQTPEIVPAPGDPRMLGDVQTAQILTVAFVDYASAESAQHASEVLPGLTEDYIDSGQLVYILHPWVDGTGSPGFQAAAAAECAGAQGQYWEMHSLLFDDQDAWLNASNPASVLEGYADTLGLNTAEFAECLSSDWAKLRVQSGNVVGALYGIPGAPVFLFSTGGAQEGSPSLEEFKSIIDAGLNQ